VVGHRGLGPAHDVGEERVGHVEHDDRDLAAAPGPQLAGRVVADVTERGDRVVDPLPGLLGHGVRAVEHVAHGADGDAGLARDLLDARRRHASPLCCPFRSASVAESTGETL
jgi:hypothetical protein